ncbi:MAG: GHKL domain-containing protein [Flammeovirgaceae bacterium]|nr:GHKL domain-containing protein [Flammeovirgaceae bacterium]
MVFNDFRFRVALRVILLGLTLALIIFMISQPNMIFATGLTGAVLLFQFLELYRFVSQTNRKLTRFLESIKYSDFISGFTADNKLGRSFRELNTALNEVLEAFRNTRSEKEEHWQYLNTVVQQVRTGILSFDEEGNIQLINANARKFIGLPAINNIKELEKINKNLYDALKDVRTGKSTLYRDPKDFLLTINSTDIRIRGHEVKLITLQNIQNELQKQELQAWQNLTRVLRHEIMNSITPISSLTSTLKDVLDHDLKKKNGHYELKSEGAVDLREGIETIESRSKGLIKFIDAYREYTSLPPPVIKTVLLKDLLEKVAQFLKQEIKNSKIEFLLTCQSEYLTIQADEEMIEQVLINLIKNSLEAIEHTSSSKIELNGGYDENSVIIEVIDNGPGIIKEALDKIFVPFFTTKQTGSGIGLSLSRQIMQMHNGNLTVHSDPYLKTVFTLRF